MSLRPSIIVFMLALSGCGKTVDLGEEPPPPDSGEAPFPSVAGGQRLWVDAERLYWTSCVGCPREPEPLRTQTLSVCAKANCDDSLAVTSEKQFAFVLPHGSEALYAVLDSPRFAIKRCADGCAQSEFVFRTYALGVRNGMLAADDRFVFWEADDGVYRCPLRADCELPEFWGGELNISLLLFDAGDWLVYESSSPPDAVSAVRKDGSAQVPAAFRGARFPDHIVSNGQSLFVASQHGISRCDTPDCDSADHVIVPDVRTAALKADATHVYWRNSSEPPSGLVFRCEIEDCDRPEQVTAVPADAVDFAVDARHVWWLTPTSLGRVAK